MAEPFLSEIRLMSFNFAPKGWALCNGQLLPINQNQALFSLLGTTYGGDGRVNFALPDLRGRVALHTGAGFTLGQRGGEELHTLTISEMPQHTHPLMANNANGTAGVAGITPGPTKVLSQGLVSLPASQTAPAQIYGTGAASGTMSADSVTNAGGSQAHENRQPFLTLNWCIALQGIFPSPN